MPLLVIHSGEIGQHTGCDGLKTCFEEAYNLIGKEQTYIVFYQVKLRNSGSLLWDSFFTTLTYNHLYTIVYLSYHTIISWLEDCVLSLFVIHLAPETMHWAECGHK